LELAALPAKSRALEGTASFARACLFMPFVSRLAGDWWGMFVKRSPAPSGANQEYGLN
jgi:hypothetical protein